MAGSAGAKGCSNCIWRSAVASGVCRVKGRGLWKLKVVGAGVGRTGTHSLKLALEQLLDVPCHHMLEILGDPNQI